MTWINNNKSSDVFYIINNDSDLSTIEQDINITQNNLSWGEIYNIDFISSKYNYLIDKKIRYTDTTGTLSMKKVRINGYYYDTSNLKLPTGYTPFRLKNNFIYLQKQISKNLQIIKADALTIPIPAVLPNIRIENQVNIVMRTK